MTVDDSLYGARASEITALINKVVGEGERQQRPKRLEVFEGEVAGGIRLRVQHQSHEKGLTRTSLCGNGWMISFTVTKQRPRNLEEHIPSVAAPINIYDEEKKRVERKNLCLFNPSVLSPEAFRKEMTLLRMFDDQWR